MAPSWLLGGESRCPVDSAFSADRPGGAVWQVTWAPRRRVVLGLALTGCLLAGVSWAPAAEPDPPFKVIVSPDVTGTSIGRASLSAVFLKAAVRWGDGTPSQPVDQSTQSPLREAFSQRVHGQPLAAVMKFWMRQITEGRGVPPPVKASDADVIAYVSSKRGAVGYVAAETPLPATVRVLQIAD